jgi:hypothetical protein
MDEKPKLQLIRGGPFGVPMKDEEKAAEREREQATRYGKFYWCIGLVDGTEIHVHADQLRFPADGGLVLAVDKEYGVNFAFAAGRWSFVYAASVIDGGAVAVEHWTAPKKS